MKVKSPRVRAISGEVAGPVQDKIEWRYGKTMASPALYGGDLHRRAPEQQRHEHLFTIDRRRRMLGLRFVCAGIFSL